MEPKTVSRLYQGFKKGFEEMASDWAGEYSTSQAHHERLTDEHASDLANEAVRILIGMGVEVS